MSARQDRWPTALGCYSRPVIDRSLDPRTGDRLVYQLLRSEPGSDPATGQPVGTATFSAGRSHVEAEENIAVAVQELLARPFVDRVQADERPRGYRRSGSGQVDLLVPGMAEHFVARMRGLWLSYPDGSVVTARPATAVEERPNVSLGVPEAVETIPAVVDPSVRRATLALSDETAGGRPLVRPHPPLSGERPVMPGAHRTDCGWLT
jgi:hypothetical protein